MSSFPPVRRGDSLPSGAILGSRGCRRGSGDRADDTARRGRGDLAGARRPGLSRGRRSVRRRRALGREARVVASILAADAVLLARLDADARWQAGGASSGTLRALGRRGGHPHEQSPRVGYLQVPGFTEFTGEQDTIEEVLAARFRTLITCRRTGVT